MKDEIGCSGIIIIFSLVVSIILCISLVQFSAIKKYYPDMTLFEYMIIGSKIRITPGNQ